MKLKSFLLGLQLFAMMLLPLAVQAKWSDPTLVVKQTQVTLGTAVEMEYYNAPSGASIVIYPQTGSVAAPAVSQTIVAGKGKASVTIPASAGSHGYYATICEGTGTEMKSVSNTVFLVGSAATGEFSLTADKEVYSRSATITINFENAPACTGDKIVIYPQSYTLVPDTKGEYVAPTASCNVNATSGTATLKVATNGYYTIYYVLEGQYTTLYKGVDIMVGTPVTVSVTKSKFIPEEDVVVKYTGASKIHDDWMGIFDFKANVLTAEPLYKVDIKGASTDEVSIPAGTLKEGNYKVATFYNGKRNKSVASMPKITIVTGTSSLQYSDDETVYYYNIISPNGNLCMTTEAVASSTADTKSMKLVTFDTQNNYAQWKLVKRDNGKVDVINRATGDCILSRSSVTTGVNYTKMGKKDENHTGLSFSLLGDDQYAISGVEEDGILRYLTNVTVGENADKLDLSVNSNFAWKMVLAETVITGIDGVKQTGESIKVKDGKIVIDGSQDYSVWNAEGMQMDKKAVLPAGVYVVRLANGKSAKIIVK